MLVSFDVRRKGIDKMPDPKTTNRALGVFKCAKGPEYFEYFEALSIDDEWKFCYGDDYAPNEDQMLSNDNWQLIAMIILPTAKEFSKLPFMKEVKH